MPNWQVTATTIRCEAVDDEVTLLVYKDWSAKCTGYLKHHGNGQAKATKKAGRQSPGCQGTECRLASEYRKKLQAEQDIQPSQPGSQS